MMAGPRPSRRVRRAAPLPNSVRGSAAMRTSGTVVTPYHGRLVHRRGNAGLAPTGRAQAGGGVADRDAHTGALAEKSSRPQDTPCQPGQGPGGVDGGGGAMPRRTAYGDIHPGIM